MTSQVPSLSMHSPAKIAAIIDYEHGGLQKNVYTSVEVEEVPCPLCGASVERADRLYVERGVLSVVRCGACDLIYVSPRLKNPEEVYFGDAEKYEREARLIFAGQAAHHRDPNYRADLKLLKRFRPTGKLLDVGTSMGFFLRHAKDQGWTVTGVEPSASLARIARERFGLEVVNAFLEKAGFESESFNILTMTDVFEHVPSPHGMLREAWRILKPGGVAFIKVPNGLYNLAKLRVLQLLGRTGSFDIFDAHEHVVHYSHKTLTAMLEQCGFALRYLGTAKPVQIPVWHQYVGAYYQYEVPFLLDWRRQFGRSALYHAAQLEFFLRRHRASWLAPNIVAIAEKVTKSGSA